MSMVDCKRDNPPTNGERKSYAGNGHNGNGESMLAKINLACPNMGFIKNEFSVEEQAKLLEECRSSAKKEIRDLGTAVSRQLQWENHRFKRKERNKFFRKNGF